MTTFEKVWEVQTVNQNIDNVDTVGTRSAYLYRLVEMLTDPTGTGAWTVIKSCDGLTASNDDAQDWTSAAKVVFGDSGAPINTGDMNNGDPHSWIELKSPLGFPTSGKYMYLLIDAANYNYGGYGAQCQIHWGTETAGLDGTTLRRPSLAVATWQSWATWTMPYNKAYYRGSPYDTSANQNFGAYTALEGWRMTFDYDAAHINYFHGARTSDGYFFCLNTCQGQGYVYAGGFILPLDTPRDELEDPWPVVGAFGACTSVGSSLGFFRRPSLDYASVTHGVILNADYSPTSNGSLNVRTFNVNGDTQSGGITGIHGNFLWSLGGINYWASDIQDNAGNSMDSKLMALPVWVGGTPTLGTEGARGRIVDLKLGPTGTTPLVPQATVEPMAGPVESVYLGEYWWPLNAAVII